MRILRSQKLLFTTAVALVFTVGATAVTAQNDEVAKNNPQSIETPAVVEAVAPTVPASSSFGLSTRVGIASAQPISLSLDEAIRKALANNNTIEITRDDVRFQETQIRFILGSYDPVFSVTPTYTRNSTTGNATEPAAHDNADRTPRPAPPVPP